MLGVGRVIGVSNAVTDASLVLYNEYKPMQAQR